MRKKLTNSCWAEYKSRWHLTLLAGSVLNALTALEAGRAHVRMLHRGAFPPRWRLPPWRQESFPKLVFWSICHWCGPGVPDSSHSSLCLQQHPMRVGAPRGQNSFLHVAREPVDLLHSQELGKTLKEQIWWSGVPWPGSFSPGSLLEDEQEGLHLLLAERVWWGGRLKWG